MIFLQGRIQNELQQDGVSQVNGGLAESVTGSRAPIQMAKRRESSFAVSFAGVEVRVGSILLRRLLFEKEAPHVATGAASVQSSLAER
jgi:hypothetical protein